VLVPAGFDLPRDLIDVGTDLGVVDVRGSYYSFDGKRIAQGEHKAVKRLHDDRKLCAELEEAVRAAIATELAGPARA